MFVLYTHILNFTLPIIFQLPSCIGVSPEGVIRYWPSVGQEGVYVDVSAELAGQECEQLGEPTKSGLVLATTTCTVVLLTPTMLGEYIILL